MNLRPVRFKYLLGEFHLGSWRPLMQPLRRQMPTASDWPRLADVPIDGLDPAADGYWCREAGIDRFPLGFSQFGPWHCYVPRRGRLYQVHLAGSFSDYLSRWSSKTRYNVRRSLKKLSDRNPAGVLHIADTAEKMEPFLREAAAISRTTYQARLLQSGLDYDEQTVRSMQSQAATGHARGYLLRDQGRAIAFAWCAGSGDRLTYEVIGYLEEAASLSPGTVLLYLIVEDLFGLGRFKVFDFGVGEAPYKQMFATDAFDFADTYLFRRTWLRALRCRLHWHLDQTSSGIGNLLERAGLKTTVRHFLRRFRRRST